MNWLGKLMDLPKEFLNCSEGPGGGIIQVSLEANLNQDKLTKVIFRVQLVKQL